MDLNSSDSDLDEEAIVRDFEKEGILIINKLLPAKSCIKYENTYDSFMKWKADQKAKFIDQNVLIVYFEELSKKFKPSTLWSQWSMLRTTLNIRHGIDMNKFEHLKTLLKNKSKGFKAKKSSVLTLDQVKSFLTYSDDSVYLSAKVILIFGICGAMRCQEICNLKISDVENTGTQFIVTVSDTKTYYPRNFIIGPELYEKVNNYIKMRPNNFDTNRFFLQYKNGVCIRQVIGKNKISEVPSIIATFLKLDNPETYTGHCFRRTAATLLANSGANLTTVKQLGGWKSSSVAESYVEHSLANRRLIFNGIINSDNSLVKENLPLRTLLFSTATTTSAIQVTSTSNESSKIENPTKRLLASIENNENVDDANEYPPFDIEDIDVALLVESKDKPNHQILPKNDLIHENEHEIHDSPSHEELSNTFSKKRVVFQDIQNINKEAFWNKNKKVKEENLKSPSLSKDEVNAMNQVSLKSPFVQFHNCVIHHLVNNNYSKSDCKK